MKPKRHHYLPEFYLNGFTEGGFLSIYDRKKKELRRQTPKNTAVIGNYYTTTDDKGEKNFDIEQLLSQFEGKAKPAFDKLNQGNPLTPDERADAGYFIAFLLSRTPRFAREIEQISDAVHKIIAKEMISTVESASELLRLHGSHERITPESMLDFVQNERFLVKSSRENILSTMFEQVRKTAKTITLSDWAVVHAPKKTAFVTTDSPLGYYTPEELRRSSMPNLGLDSCDVTKIVPITKSTALLIGRLGGRVGHFSVSKQQVREINMSVASECEQYLIGHNEELVKAMVRRRKLDRDNPGTWIKVENVYHPEDPNRSFLIARRVSPETPSTPLVAIRNPDGTYSFR